MSDAVNDYIQNLSQPWQVEVATQLQAVVARAIPDAESRIMYSKPHYRKNGKYAAVISVSKPAVSFTIFNADNLELPDGLFDGPPERKTIKIKEGQVVGYDQLATLLQTAGSTL